MTQVLLLGKLPYDSWYLELFCAADIKDGFLELISHWMDGNYDSSVAVGGVLIV